MSFGKANAQHPLKEISGTVQDAETKEPLPGVIIKVKNASNRGAATDANGKYRINVAGNEVLQLSYMGYSNIEIAVSSITNNIITLKPQSTDLSEVVVIGYGTVERGDLTGAVGEVNMEDLTKAPVASFDQALAGRVAGVNVASTDGQPGEEMGIVIRGGNSLTQENSPLYVIDGFPMEDFTSASLNQNDIKSITILKDASATAIYGARGANGVVVIETKSGQIGKPAIVYDGSIGINTVTQKMDMLDVYEFVKYQYALNPTVANTRYLGGGKTVESYRDVKGYDWQDMIFRTAASQNHYLSVSGGTAQTKYNISGSIFDRDGVIINSGFNRYQGRLSIDQTISNKVKAGIRANYSNQTANGQIVSASNFNTYSTSLMYAVWGYRPVTGNNTRNLEDELYDEDDISADRRMNPVLSTRNEYRRRISENLNVNAYLTYELAPGLQLKITGGANNRLMTDKEFNNSKTIRGNLLNPNNTRFINGSILYSERFDWTNENLLTYSKTFDTKHKLNAVGGFTLQGANASAYGYYSQRIPDEELGIASLGQGEAYSTRALESNSTLMSFLSRAIYTYNQRYIFTGTFRADGSSKFAPGNRWGYFPSGAFAWRMGRENFLKYSKVISDAKLRMSYGLTGNNRVGDFDYLQTMTIPDAGTYSFDNVPYLGAIPATLGNTDLRWETTAQLDLGYDISFLKNRINLTVDLYRKTTSDLLLNANMVYSSGYKTVRANMGKIQNQGLEISLNTVNVKNKKFSWSSDFNISFNQNKILELANNEDNIRSNVSWIAVYNTVPLYMAKVGMSAAQFYGYMFDGIYQYDDFTRETNGNYTLKPSEVSIPSISVQPGDPRYKDVNGDGIIDVNDRVIIGRTLPIHTGGFNNNFQYKGLSLNVLFQWSYGNDIFNGNRMILENNEMNRVDLNMFKSALNFWSPENQNNTNPRLKATRLVGAYTSQYIEDGSYLRLKTVSLAYTIPKKYIGKWKIDNLNVFASGQNLFTWTNYSGMDPEVSIKNSILTPGFDYSAYPMGRVLMFGVKAGF